MTSTVELASPALLGELSRGLWTRQEALAVMSRGRVQSQVRRGHWQVPWPGVFADAGVELDAEQRAYAAALACDARSGPSVMPDGRRCLRAVPSGRTAARLHSLPLIDDLDPSTGACEELLDDVTVRRHSSVLRTRTTQGVTRELTRTARGLSRRDVVQLPSGLWVTTPLRTLMDCASLLTPEALTCAVDAALHRHLVDERSLSEAAQARWWQPGAPVLRWAVERADRRAESPAETLSRLALLPSLPGLVPQHRLLDQQGRVLARLDLADERLRLAVEADGKAGHAGASMAARDRRRDARSSSLGWRTERVTWWELRRDRPAFVRRVEVAAAEQAARHGV